MFKDISELEKLMSDEEKIKARELYEKYFLKPFGDKEKILIISEDDGEDYLREVDVNDFE